MSTAVSETGVDTSNEDVDSRSRFRKFVDAITPDKHRTIERAGANFIAMAVVFAFILLTSFYYWTKGNDKALAETPMYTQQFVTSKTQVEGEVAGIYGNKDHTKAMVLMHFPDSSKMSAQAANYRSFLTGSNTGQGQEKLKSRPAGSIYVFGSSGYMGVYLADTAGFKSQIMNLTMRANAQLVDTSDEDTAAMSSEPDMSANATFKKYDQWRIFFNPGASKIEYATSLDASAPKVDEMYYDMVIKSQEDKLRTTLDADLVKMKADLTSINDYKMRLSTMSVNGVGVKIPPMPSIVNGDEVTGKSASAGVKSTLMLKSKETFNNGFNFDWRKGNVKSGYIDGVVPKGENYVNWFADHSRQTPQAADLNQLEWTMTDGRKLEDISSDSAAALDSFTQLSKTVNDLTSAIAQYRDDKLKYQVDDLGSLLGLEVAMRQVNQNNTVNTSPKVVALY